MRLSIAASLALCLATAQAFKNTSPFLLFSNSEQLDIKDHPKQLLSNNDIISSAQKALSKCPSRHYVLVSQEGVGAEDFTSQRAVPFLRRAMKNEGVKSVLNVAEVVGQDSTEAIIKFLREKCNALEEDEFVAYFGKDIIPDEFRPKFTQVKFPALPSTEPARSAKLADYDSYLNVVLENLPLDTEFPEYTVIYTTTPVSTETHITYEPSFQEPLHVELKRQMDFVSRAEKNTTGPSLPLFEKYQFLSPGIFMGLITVIILLAILSVGVSAISGLQVSYGAFDKETGPTSSKKQ